MMKAKCLRMYILLCALFAAGSLGAQQFDVKARIAGLEKNGEYMSLLRPEASRREERTQQYVHS